MTARLVVPLAALALSACADAQSPSTGAPSEVVVTDGRDRDEGTVSKAREAWAETPAVGTAVAFARAHWTAADPGYEEEVRVLAVAEGAFAEAGAREHVVLYLMALWPRCCPKLGLAVVGADDRLVRNVAFEGTFQDVRPVPDLDGDGRDELALSGTFGMGGDVSGSVK